MSKPTRNVTDIIQDLLDVTGAIILAAAIGLAGIMSIVCIAGDTNVAYWLVSLAYGGCLAAEIVELLGKHPAPPRWGWKAKLGHYQDSFNHARFWWRVASWALLVAAGHVAVGILKGDTTPTCSANAQANGTGTAFDYSMLWFIIPFTVIALIFVWVWLGRFISLLDRPHSFLAGLRSHYWEVKLFLLGVAVVAIWTLVYQDCT